MSGVFSGPTIGQNPHGGLGSLGPGGLATTDFSAANVAQAGFFQTTLGQKAILPTEHTHQQAPTIGHFGVADTIFGRTVGEYGPHPGWERSSRTPLWNDQELVAIAKRQWSEWTMGPHAFVSYAAFRNLGTYNNMGAPNVIPSTKPVAAYKLTKPAHIFKL